MKKAFGVIELLISFLLLSIIIAGFMHMTLIQMQDGQIEHTRLEEVQNQADEMINEIEDIRQKNLEYEEDLLNEQIQNSYE